MKSLPETQALHKLYTSRIMSESGKSSEAVLFAATGDLITYLYPSVTNSVVASVWLLLARKYPLIADGMATDIDKWNITDPLMRIVDAVKEVYESRIGY